MIDLSNRLRCGDPWKQPVWDISRIIQSATLPHGLSFPLLVLLDLPILNVSSDVLHSKVHQYLQNVFYECLE